MKWKCCGLITALALLCAGCGANTPPEQPAIVPEEPSAAEDRVLSVAAVEEPPLTLAAVGRQTEDGTRLGVCEIQVYEGGGLAQILSVQEAIDTDGVDGILPGYTECPEPDQLMTLRDMNFDGVPDIGLYGWSPNNTIPHYYWLWDETAEAYRYAFCLQGAEADAETETVVSQYKAENGVYHTDRYRYDESGALELVQREVEDWTRGSQDAPLREVYDVIDGQLALQE